MAIKRKVETKLTTVKVITGLYSKFKQLSYESNLTLQKLVNRSIDRYIHEEEYRMEINDYTGLETTGSQF